MSVRNLAYSLCGPAILAGLLVMALLVGCAHDRIDSRLLATDSMIDSHPDSALKTLNAYRLLPESSAGDSAYYALLLTHARYKNFIDEADDSLISVAADYFLGRHDAGKASRALFLKGMIQMNANRLGDAAVSFRKGLDMAHESKIYMWEGQCARGLFAIYGRIKNYSEQIKYAQAEYDAFVNGNYQDWSNFARLNILRAYHNNRNFDNVLLEATQLLSIAEELQDTVLMEEVLLLKGTCQYATNDFKGALDSYRTAYSLNPSLITAEFGYNVMVAAERMNSLTDETKRFVENVASKEETLPAFKVLANQGHFEEAFYGLERYKNLQDSVLHVIIQNNVAESMDFYENTIMILRQQKVRIERMLWTAGILILIMIIGLSYWIHKKNLNQKELERRQLQMSMEILQSDLASQISDKDNMAKAMQRLIEKNQLMSSALHDMLYERYKKINMLCDSYFEGRVIESKKKKLDKEMGSILKDFSDQTFLQEIAEHIDRCLDGLYSSFVEEFPELNEDTKRLFMFLTMGLSNRSICVILNVEHANLYNRKSRLKKLIAGSGAKRKGDFLKNIG